MDQKYSSITYESCFKRSNYYPNKFDCDTLKVKVLLKFFYLFCIKFCTAGSVAFYQTLIEMSTRNISWGIKGDLCIGLTNFPPSCEILELSWLVQACIVIAITLLFMNFILLTLRWPFRVEISCQNKRSPVLCKLIVSGSR